MTRTRRTLALATVMALAALPSVVAAVDLTPPAFASVVDPSRPGTSAAGRAASTPIRLAVDARSARHPISPLIYGVNFAPADFARAVRLPVNRWGGDSTETYNWRINAANQGLNYYFTNYSDCWDERFGYCSDHQDFSAVDELVQQDIASRSATILNLPALGWVAKDGSLGAPGSCSYPTAVYPEQDDVDPYNPLCGFGTVNGQVVTDPPVDPTRAGLEVDASFSGDWVRSLVDAYGDAAHGGVDIYELGNEPGLWNETHRDFSDGPLTYDGLWSRARDLSTAVKTADPTAATLGPSEWGWISYFCSGADDPFDHACTASSPDRAAHGGVDLATFYLQRFAALEKSSGVRHLDYFDWHYYPAGGARDYSPVTDVTRSLWDPTYTDPSYVAKKIALVPRMKALVAKSYPGTRTAVTEYNLGLGTTAPDDSRLQTIIEADTLGIFGREALDLATFWSEGDSPLPEQAFRLFRNYDGRHSGFGNVSVSARSASQGRLAVYAAQRGAGGALTLMVINKTGTALRGRLALAHFRPKARAQVFQYAGAGIVHKPSLPVAREGFTASYPGRSVTVVVLPPA